MAEAGYGLLVPLPESITCVDCGGTCHLVTYAPEEGFAPGDIVAFRCEQCLDRWDIVLTADDIDDDAARGDAPPS